MAIIKENTITLEVANQAIISKMASEGAFTGKTHLKTEYFFGSYKHSTKYDVIKI